MIIGLDSLRIKADGSTIWLRTEFWRGTACRWPRARVSLSTELDTRHKQVRDKLVKLSGNAFDRA